MAGSLSTQLENCQSADERMWEGRRLRSKDRGSMGKAEGKSRDVMNIKQLYKKTFEYIFFL